MRSFAPNSGLFVLLALLILASALPATATAQDLRSPELPGEPAGSTLADPQPTTEPPPDEQTVPGQIIVKYKKHVSPAEKATIRQQEKLDKKKDLGLIDAEVSKVEGRSVEEAVRDLEGHPNVEYAEPDFKVYPTGYVDEPRFSELWGLHNTGQTVNSIAGSSDADINALEASAVTQGDPNLVVAVIDEGVDFSHPDLAGRAWVNPGESGGDKEINGIDDDGNGYVDDVNGWDFHYKDGTVYDAYQDDHGTHVAGTIAGSVNGQGVAGVAPNVKIMSLKFLGPHGGSTSDAILAIEYAKKMGARISNNSWGGGSYSQAEKDAIEASGMLFVAAAGNGGSNRIGDNTDTVPHYPASYDSPNILSVAAVDNSGKLATFSNYGLKSVDISAPGVDILSAIPGEPGNAAAALSSVGPSGKALVAGFGVEEINSTTGRVSFIQKALSAVGRTSEPVVLVDDDLSSSGFTDLGPVPDVGPTVTTAMESATGTSPETIDVGLGDGPALSRLEGKVVVWVTGRAANSGYSSTTLTPADQQTLTDFLNGGGKLVIAGMDALFRVSNSPFVTETLDLSVSGDVDITTFVGSPGTRFVGESYDLTNPLFAKTDYHDKIVPAVGSSTVVQGRSIGGPGSWKFMSGTSMAAPHTTGVAALAASVSPALLNDPVALKNHLMVAGKPAPATASKTASGKLVDAEAALDTTPPETTIDSGPSGTVNTSSVNFAFSSNEAGSTFECSMDGAAFSPCTSSKTYDSLADGSHTFGVRAIDKVRHTDPTPASSNFTVDATAPAINSPTDNLVSGSTLGTSTIPVKLSWSGSDAGSGIARYELEQSTNAGAYTPVSLPSPTDTTVTLNLDPAKNYSFRVRALDGAGNWSGWAEGQNFRLSAFQETSAKLTYSTGTWTSQSLSTAYGGTVKHEDSSGAKSRFTFTANEVAWITRTSPSSGRAEIWIDGVEMDGDPDVTGKQPFDLYSSTAKARQMIVRKANLDPAVSHTLEVRVLGTKRSASSGTRVDVDAFVTID